MENQQPLDPQGGDREEGRGQGQGQAAAKAGQGRRSAKAVAGPSTSGPSVTPNGVVVSLKNVAGATLTVETAQGKFHGRRSIGWPMARPCRFWMTASRAQRVFPHAPLFEGPNQQDFPAAAADAQGTGAWVAAVWHEPRGPELLPAVNEQPKNFAEFLPTGGGDQVRFSTSRMAKPARRSTSPSPAATSGGPPWPPPATAASSSSGPRSATTTGTSSAAATTPRPARSRPSMRITDEPGPDSDAVLATAADGTVWMAWQAWTDGQADILLVPLGRDRQARRTAVKISDTPANEWAPSHRGRHERPGPCGVRHLPGRQLRRPAPHPRGRRHARARRSPWPARRRSRPGPAWRPIPAAGSGSPMKNERPTGARTPSTCSTARARASIAPSKVVVAVVDGGRVLHAPDPLEHAPDSLKNMNSYPRLRVDRAGRPWLAFRHRQEAIWGNNAVIVTGAVWTSHATSLSGSAWSPPQPLTRSDGLLDNRPALVQPAEGPVLAFYSTDGRLRREVEMNPQASLKYFSNQGTPPGVFNVDLEVSALVADRPARRASPEPAPAARHEPCRKRPPRRNRRPATASGPIESRPAARPTGCSAASSTAIPRSPPTAAPTARSKTCGAMRSTPPARLDRQRRPRQRRRQGIHLVADPEDDRPVQPARRRSSRCSPTSGASPTRTATAT